MNYLNILNKAWDLHLKPKKKNAPTVISTFAGCGGSTLGYSMAGYKELLAVEWDDKAVETFKINFPKIPVYHGDICKLSTKECLSLAGIKKGELDVFDGSPPCQGFSTAGKRDFNDSRNYLFKEYARLLKGLQPKVFAIDSTGISTNRFVQWVHAKYTDPKLIEQRQWVKMHLVCGVKTNVVTAVEITDRFAGDSPMFKPLIERTAVNFVMDEVSADKAYLSNDNLALVLRNQAMPYIPFKSDSNPYSQTATNLWTKMYHFFALNQEKFFQHYHKRSNAESTVMMIKAKFGDSLRSRTDRAQINEALCKVLSHNICCLISAMYELGLKPKFWKEI